MGLVEKREEGTKGALLEDVVAALGAVAGDVAEGPHGLFSDVEHGRRQKFDENGDGAGFDDDRGVFRGARGDVGEGPRGFKLLDEVNIGARWVGGGMGQTWIMECSLRRNSTKRATTPHSMTFSMGGLRSLDRSLRNLVVASSCWSGWSEKTP